MPRATNGPASRKRRKRVLLRAKGFRGFRSKLFRYAKDAVYKARQYEYRDRKKRKGQFRRLWIQRISAGVREQGLTYSRFIEGLNAAEIEVDRKVLADLAVHDLEAFNTICEAAKEGLKMKAEKLAAEKPAEATA
ncbi:MAG: 50S ribosomal protein L20 [Verrucomicrobiota bacterium]